jgi:hypothetical protein
MRDWALKTRVQVFRVSVQGLGFRVYCSGFIVCECAIRASMGFGI